jgi:DNA-3-methyladenine glycosylase I
MNDAGIIRNRSKILASIGNAQAYLRIMEDGPGSFDRFLWKHVGGRTIVNGRKGMKDLPASSSESDAMSKDLKKHGFKFVGTTIVYAFMQACGMVDDHIVTCWRRTG